MAKKKAETAEAVEAQAPAEQKFPLASLLQSAEFTSLEKDFLKAYATKKGYTVAEARTLLDKKLKEVAK